MLGTRMETMDDLIKRPALSPFMRSSQTGEVLAFNPWVFYSTDNREWVADDKGPSPEQLVNARTREKAWKAEEAMKQPKVEIPGIDQLITLVRNGTQHGAPDTRSAKSAS